MHENGNEKAIAYFGVGSIYPIITTAQDFILEQSIMVQALDHTETMAFSFEETRKILREHPDIAYECIDHYCKFTNFLFFTSMSQTFEDLQTRICNILYIYYTNSNDTKCSLTQSDLASFIGAARNSVVKVLKQLREQEIIQTTNKYIEILDIPRLMNCVSILTI